MANELFEDVKAIQAVESADSILPLLQADIFAFAKKFNVGYHFGYYVDYEDSHIYNICVQFFDVSSEIYFAALDYFNLVNGKQIGGRETFTIKGTDIDVTLDYDKAMKAERATAMEIPECKVELIKICPNASLKEKATLRRQLRKMLADAY